MELNTIIKLPINECCYDCCIDDSYSVNIHSIVSLVVSIVLRLYSIYLNLVLAYEYYFSNNIQWMIFTIICIFLPMIVTSCLQLAMYYDDKKQNKNVYYYEWHNIIIFIVVIPFFFRYGKSLYFALKCKWYETNENKLEQKRYYDLLLASNSDIALIRIFECFIETAPQKTLQLSIMIPFTEVTVSQIKSVSVSLISLAWCVASYNKNIRLTRKNKNEITIIGIISQFLWLMTITVSRIFAIALIASFFPKSTLIACFIHIFIMTNWIFFFDRSPFYEDSTICSYLFSLALGFVYIFNYITPKEGRTLYRYIFFYTIIGIENLTCILYGIYEGIYNNVEDKSSIIYIIISSIIFINFSLGIFFMIIYYLCFHPNVIYRAGIF